MNLNNYKTAGVIYKITKEELVGKNNDYPKRFLFLEVPSLNSMDNQTTEVWKFTIMGPECGSLDYYEEKEWLEVTFKIEGRFWKPKDEPDKEVHFMNLRIVDMARATNPFDMNQEPESPSVDEITPDLFKDLEDRSEAMKKEKTGGDKPEYDDDLPF